MAKLTRNISCNKQSMPRDHLRAFSSGMKIEGGRLTRRRWRKSRTLERTRVAAGKQEVSFGDQSLDNEGERDEKRGKKNVNSDRSSVKVRGDHPFIVRHSCLRR